MKDSLSAFFDGELDEAAAEGELAGLRRDAVARERWQTYALIGDALRGEQGTSPDFVAGVMARLDAEPVVLAPGAARELAHQRSRLPARLAALAASAMGVAVVGWLALSLQSQQAPGAGRMLAARTVPAAVPQASVVRIDPHREYVFAHQASAAGGALAGGVQYVRTVSAAGQGGVR